MCSIRGQYDLNKVNWGRDPSGSYRDIRKGIGCGGFQRLPGDGQGSRGDCSLLEFGSPCSDFAGMNLEVMNEAGVSVVRLASHHLDFENVVEFRRAMDEILGEADEVVIDMSSLEFVDSSGLGAILSAVRRLSSRGGDLRLAGVTPSVAALLQLVRLDQIIQIYETSDEAVRSFQ